MRHLAITACLTLLAACGKGAGGNASASGNISSAFGDSFRQSYRVKFVDSCATGAKQAAARSGNPAAAGLDYLPLCQCAADRLLATHTVTELMSGPSQAEQAAVTQQCLKEHPLT